MFQPVGVVPTGDEDASKGSLEKTDDKIQRRRGTGLWWGSKVLCHAHFIVNFEWPEMSANICYFRLSII